MAINYGKLNAKLTPRGSLKATMGVSGPLNSDYEALINKPQINGNELIGDKSNADLGIPTALEDLTDDSTHRVVTDEQISTWNNKSDFSGSYNDLTDKPTIPDELADLTDDSTHRLVTDTEKTTWNAKSDFSGSYNDLTDKPTIPDAQIQSDWNQSDNTKKDFIKNKPTIPASQVNSDWNASSGVAEILNKPTLGTAAAKDSTNAVTQGSTDLVESGAVWSAIDNLPEPMVFKGTLGVNGTITSLPTALSSNNGYTYKVITDGTYDGKSAKVGDVFTSNGSEWVLIPSGDETFTDTWRSVKVNDTELLGSSITTGAVNFKSGSNVSISGSGNDITFSAQDTTYSKATAQADGLMSKEDFSKLSGVESGAQVNTITGVKGNAESEYRTGNVNITPTNIGLGNVDNTSDATKKSNFTGSIASGNTGFVTGGDVYSALGDKVDKVEGKGLSTNDYTTTEKNKLAGIASGAEVNVQSDWNQSDNTKDDYIKNKPTKVSQFTNDNGFTKVESSETNGNIKIDTVETQVYDDSEIKGELSTDTTTIEGNPLNFSTLSAQTAKSTILSVEPIQDLHGYDKPWVGGAGKNLLPLTVDGIKANNGTSAAWTGNSRVISGVTFTILTDSDNNVIGIKANGSTSTSAAFLYLGINTFNPNIYRGMYLNGAPGSSSSTTYCILIGYYTGTTWKSEDYSVGSDLSIKTNESYDTVQISIYVRPNTTITNQTFYPMIRETSASATFEPYTNLCPISGHNQIDILGCGKNLLPNTYTTQSINDVKFTVNDDGTIYAKGTANSIIRWNVVDFTLPRKGRYIISCGEKTNGYYGTLRYAADSAFVIDGILPNGSEFEVTDETVVYRFNYIVSNGTAIDTLISPMVRLVSNADSNYEPYNKNTDLTISLGQTVYGGTIDVENGVLVVDMLKQDLSELSWTWQSTWQAWYANLYGIQRVGEGIPNLVSEKYEARKFSDVIQQHKVGISVSGASDLIAVNDNSSTDTPTGNIAYQLATPITINLTPHTINLLKGVNNISVDDANSTISLTYRDGSVATLGDLTSAVDELDGKIEDSKILTDTATGDKYILVVTNGVLDIQQISN